VRNVHTEQYCDGYTHKDPVQTHYGEEWVEKFLEGPLCFYWWGGVRGRFDFQRREGCTLLIMLFQQAIVVKPSCDG
jgi:hypothetical protein